MKRRAPMRRKSTLRRRTRMRQRSDKPRRGPPRDEEYKALVRALECAATDRPGHDAIGARDAHHAGYSGIGQQGSDYETIPLHRICHGQWHDGCGVFAGMTKAQRAEWSREAIERTQRQVAARTASGARRYAIEF